MEEEPAISIKTSTELSYDSSFS